jgi:hypothetical protein
MSDYRLAAGTITELALLADDSNIITNFPAQSDQVLPTYAWLPASFDIVQPYVSRVQALDRSMGRFGKGRATLRLAVLTQEMWHYMDQTFFSKGSAEGDEPNESAAVTVYVRDRLQTGTLEWAAYHATMIRPEITFEAIHPHAVIYHTDVAFELVGMTLASAGVGFTRGFSIGFDA